MVKRKLIYFIFLLIFTFSSSSFGNPNLDQWLDSEKTYKDLINEGYEVKSYSISDIQTDNGLMLILFVTVLQKDNDLYECHEYQTMDQGLETLDMTLICKQLVQPYQRGIGT
mgnify:CR=1 FL=1|tara:strand:- start:33 stop:368 length:336 start_codon:yes stop_codon:yes gene_type:complete